MAPLVSIGMPVFNGEPYLRDALDSLLGQTFADFEIVISDNASTDATEGICRDYARRDPRIRYHRSRVNLGANANFNRVFQLSRGRYFKWAAHDDVCAPTYLARCVEVLGRDASVVLCHSRTVLVDAAGREISDEEAARGWRVEDSGMRVYLRQYDPARRLDSAIPHRRFGDVLLSTRWCFEVFGLIRADALERTPFGDYYGADKGLLAALSLKGRFAEVPEPLFFRRCHPAQSTSIPSARSRTRWSSPRGSRGLVIPEMRCFAGYCRSVLRARLGWYEGACCVLVIGRWALRAKPWIDLGRRAAGAG